MAYQCKHCGKYDCKDHTLIIGKPIKISEFSGSSPPEIFVGRYNYPNVYTGILSPQEYGNTQIMSSSEEWHSKKLPISKILELRNKLIYGRTESYIKRPKTKFLEVMKEIAMTHKSTATEFKLKKSVSSNKETDIKVPLIPKAAPIKKVRLEENTKVKKKVDYLVNDTDVKSRVAMQELEKAKIPTSNIIKILSAGLLGLKKNRKLVPTRWSIVAVDDSLAKNKLNEIRYFNTIDEIHVFQAEYIGVHIEFLLLPDKYSFEVIESAWSFGKPVFWQDYESFFPRKKYADNVAGAYYATRLPLLEHLHSTKRQAQCLVIIESRPEHYAPLGVGIHREISRQAFKSPPKKFNTIKEAVQDMKKRLQLPINNYINRSWLLKSYGKQKRLIEYF